MLLDFLPVDTEESREAEAFLLDLILTCSCTVARVQPQIWKLRSIQVSHGCRYLLQSESVDKYRHKPQVLSEEHLVKVQSVSRYFILMHRKDVFLQNYLF